MRTERSHAQAPQWARQSKHSFRCELVITLAIAFFSVSLALADPPATKTLFNIDAQPAKTSLTLYARQARVQLGFAADIVDDILTNPVKGEYESAQALELLLAGTGLEAEYGESGVIIRRVPQRESTSDIKEAEPSIASTTALQLTETAFPTAAQIPTSSTDDRSGGKFERSLKKSEEIVVTGSRIRGAQNASPVVTITRQEINRAGFATVEELVENLPQNFGAGASLDAHVDFVNTRNVVGGRVDDRAGGTSVNLRGLGASSTLVLLNGHRMSPSGLKAGFTDISSIPMTAIERVEVLTDGASAIYGSDAIGGVVNFILRDDYEGAETRVRYGVAEGGDKPEALFGQSFGKFWDSGNILLTYEYYDSDNLANSDRDITSTNDLSRFGGTDWRSPGGNPANIIAGGQTFAIPAGQDGTALTAADFDPNAPLNLYNRRAVGDIIPAQERDSAFIHVTQHIGKAEVFAEAHFSNHKSLITRPAGGLRVTVTDANPFFVDPTGTGLTSVTVDTYVFNEDIGPSESFGEIDTIGATLGVRRDITNSWEVELVSTWSKENATAGDNNRLNPAAVAAAANQTDSNLAFNPFVGGSSNTNPSVLETFTNRTREVDNESENELWGISLGVDGELLNLPGGRTVDVAGGVEFREEALRSADFVDERISDTSRGILAAYAEVFFPLIGNTNSRPGAQRLQLSLAGRYEDYSDFGSSTNPKVGLVWSPTQTLTLKGTYGTAFRAPALFDLDVSDPNANFTTYFPQFIADLLSFRFPVIVRLGSNEDLTAEEAKTWTAGFQWSPERISGLSLDLTYFDIDFEDRIDFPGSDLVAGVNDPRFAPLLTLNPTLEEIAALVNASGWENTFGDFDADLLSGATPVGGILDFRKTNLAQMVVTGVDLQLSYDFQTALGAFAVGLNGNYMFDFERRLLEADPLVDEVDRLGRPIDFKARGNVTWSREEWSVSGFVNYADGYTDNVSDPARPVDSWTTVGLTIAYDAGDADGFLSGTRWLLTTQNLFGEEPPFVNTIGGLGYDTTNANAVGRVLALQITKDW